jgi:hypothetical protein
MEICPHAARESQNSVAVFQLRLTAKAPEQTARNAAIGERKRGSSGSKKFLNFPVATSTSERFLNDSRFCGTLGGVSSVAPARQFVRPHFFHRRF